MHSLIPTLSWVALLASIVLWGGVAYVAWNIESGEGARAATLAELEQESVRHTATLRLRTLARETQVKRAALEEIVQKDIITMLESVENAGREAGVSIEIGEALFMPSNEEGRTRTLSFAVEGRGTFGKLMHAVSLLESLPLPSSIDDLHVEYLPTSLSGPGKSASLPWRLVAHIHFLTSADVSS